MIKSQLSKENADKTTCHKGHGWTASEPALFLFFCLDFPNISAEPDHESQARVVLVASSVCAISLRVDRAGTLSRRLAHGAISATQSGRYHRNQSRGSGLRVQASL